MAVSKRLRYEVLRRDNHQCRYCGATAPDAVLTVDHVAPKALGGTDDPSNLVTACKDCNSGKSASSPDAAIVADVSQDALRWTKAMEEAVQRRTAEYAANHAEVAAFAECWDAWRDCDENLVPRDPGWERTILRLLAAGLDRPFLRYATRVAMEKQGVPIVDRWRYFCGVCWRELDSIQEEAATIFAASQQSDSPDAEWDEQGLALASAIIAGSSLVEASSGMEARQLAQQFIADFVKVSRRLYEEMREQPTDSDRLLIHRVWAVALDETIERAEAIRDGS